MAVTAEEVGAHPAMWEHVKRTYFAMRVASETSEGRVYYTGFISSLMFDELGVPVPYYGKVLGILKLMGCVAQIRRGGGRSQSQWELFEEPTLENFEKAWEQYKGPPKTDPMEAKMKDVTRMVGGVDVPKAIADLQQQLNLLKEMAHDHT